MYVGEKERNVRTRTRERFGVVKIFNSKKSALSQHVVDLNHKIAWDYVKILKKSDAFRCCVVERFLISKQAYLLSVIHYNDCANFPVVLSTFTTNK